MNITVDIAAALSAVEVLSRSRVRGERGRVQVRRRPTVSALSGPVSIRRMDHHAFLAPPHRTERAVLPHSALGRVSHAGMRRRPKTEASELKHPEFPKHDVIAKALRPPRVAPATESGQVGSGVVA